MLARARLRDDARLAHAHRQQNLAKAIVDLVRARMIELVALEIDFGAAEFLGHAIGVVKRAWTASVMQIEIVDFGLKCRIGLSCVIGAFKIKDQRHQGFSDKAATEKTKETFVIGAGRIAIELGFG